MPEAEEKRSFAIGRITLITAVIGLVTALVSASLPQRDPDQTPSHPVIVQPSQNVVVNVPAPAAPAPPASTLTTPAPAAPAERLQDPASSEPQPPSRSDVGLPVAGERALSNDGWEDRQSSVVVGNRQWSRPCGAAGMPACD